MNLKKTFRMIALSMSVVYAGQALAAAPDSFALRGIYNCGTLKIGMTAHLGELDSNNKTFNGLYHFYPVAEPAAKEGCFEVRGELNKEFEEMLIQPRKWILQPNGYGAADLKIDMTQIGEGKAIGYIQHPSCSGPFELTVVNDVEPMPALCESSRVELAAVQETKAGSSAQAAKAPPKKLSAFSLPTQKFNELSCAEGQANYRGKLLGYAADNVKLEGKQNYYAVATYMGYFSDDPVEREEIVKKVKPIIDADLEEARTIINSNDFFLLHYSNEESNSSFLFGERTQTIPRLSRGGVSYDWENNSAEFKVLIDSEPRVWGGGEIRHRIEVSAKDWKNKYAKYFGDINGHGNNIKLVGTRSLVRYKNSHTEYFEPLYIELFDTKTGKSIIRWSPTGEDVDALSKLVPQVPFAKVPGNQYGCKSLNRAYYKK